MHSPDTVGPDDPYSMISIFINQKILQVLIQYTNDFVFLNPASTKSKARIPYGCLVLVERFLTYYNIHCHYISFGILVPGLCKSSVMTCVPSESPNWGLPSPARHLSSSPISTLSRVRVSPAESPIFILLVLERAWVFPL